MYDRPPPDRHVPGTGRDPQLGLADRAGIEHALARMLERGPATALVLLPTRFHELLAAIGRSRSDALLQALAARLSHAAGPDAVVGRIAPACFAVAIPDAPDDVERVERLIATLDAPLIVDGVPYPVRAAAGSAVGPLDGDDAGQLLDRAEIALHSADGPHRRYHEGFERAARHRLAVLSDLERALASGQLRLHFQPIIDIGTGAVDCVEALVRWDHPVHGAMPPGMFIPLAEQTELIGPLTEHVLGLALDHCVAWREDGLPLTVAVNLSARNVVDPALAGRVGEMLLVRGLDGSALKLEITESVLMERQQVAFTTLEALRGLGIKLALDDFGTGYSSLAYLQDLPIDEVKIDRSFVRLLGTSERSAAVLRAIVTLADDLELRTVAEGVEDPATLRLVTTLGCTLAQGFHFARPLSPSGLRMWLTRRAAAQVKLPLTG
ncbi:putative bifunctional diguanylate cyclase/phosphodiesterase [Paraconexibacter sp.]|uniref:putative bifunctional diguanylate cyclase/phosphodiesterase n=1 Tax=Paraconexibacter sp. TaxID=2949640 RepID=UPI003569D46B